MSRGLLVVDVQIDFCEGGALGVEGGNEVANRIAELLMDRPGLYSHIFASQDWHNAPPDDNGGHFALGGAEPDFVTSWPVHCVANTPGSDTHPVLMNVLMDVVPAGHLTFVRKGQGRPDYSAFQGLVVNDDKPLAWGLADAEVTSLDIVGIATDHCVKESTYGAMDARMREVRVVTDLCAGVDPARSEDALEELLANGAFLTESRYL